MNMRWAVQDAGSALLCWPRDNILTYRSERFPRRKVNKTAGVGSQGVSYLELLTNFHKIWTLFLSLRKAVSLTPRQGASVINFVDIRTQWSPLMHLWLCTTSYCKASSLWRPIKPRLDSIVKVNSLNIKYCEKFSQIISLTALLVWYDIAAVALVNPRTAANVSLQSEGFAFNFSSAGFLPRVPAFKWRQQSDSRINDGIVSAQLSCLQVKITLNLHMIQFFNFFRITYCRIYQCNIKHSFCSKYMC